MRDIFIKNSRIIGPICLSLFLAFTLTSQNLYQDAITLSKAIKVRQLTMKVTAATPVEVEASLPGVTDISFSLPGTRALRPNMSYNLTSSSNDTFAFSLYNQLDTLDIPFVPGSMTLKNEEGMVTVSYGDTTFNWVKKEFVAAFSILEGYEFSATTRPTQNHPRSDLNRVVEDYRDNPYLSSIVNRLALRASDSLQVPSPVSDSIMTAVKNIRGAGFSASQDFLLEGEKTTTDYLISIRDVQLKYQTPPVSNFSTLNSISNRIKVSSALSGQGDFSTQLLVGLSDFIVERAQEEFNVAFMNRLKERLDSVPELRVLFPRSQLFFDQIDITNYKSLLSSAREAFVSDIQNISSNFPLLFNLDKYKELNNNPAVYNLISLYKVVDLVYQGVPLDTLLPLAFHELRDRQTELNKEINLKIAQNKIERAPLNRLASQVAQLEDSLVAVLKVISLKQAEFYQNLPDALFDAETDEQAKALDQLNNRSLQELAQPYAALKNGWDTTRLIPSYLQGRYNYDYLLENPRINEFGKYFDQAPDSTELVGAGLELTRYLVNGINGGPNKAELIQEWAQRVLLYNAQLKDLVASFVKPDTLTILQTRLDSLNTARINLQNSILTDIPFWKQKGGTLQDTMALKYLAGTLSTFYYADRQAKSITDSVKMRRKFLDKVTNTLKPELDSLQTHLKTSTRSPLQETFFIQDSLSSLKPSRSKTKASIQWLIKASNDISLSLDTLTQNCCNDLVLARKNAAVVGGALELSSFMLNSFRVDLPSNKWMTRNQFNQLTGDQVSRDIYLGLIFQQLKSVPIARGISSAGVASLASDFVSTLSEINFQRDTIAYRDSLGQRKTFKDYLPIVAASVQLMNQVLETPFLMETNALGNRVPTSLVQQKPALKEIPEVSRTILALFENTSNQNYRYAVSNLVSLVETLSTSLEKDCSKDKSLTKKQKKECEKKNKELQYLVKYGNFIADVAMAKSPEEVKAALSNVALPPGSSWTKRVDPFNVSLNAYFGGAVGRENLSGEDAKFFPFNNFSLTVPVGLAFSAKLPKNMKGSWSLFFPILDLGAISAYRINEPDNNLPVLSFQNVIAPGTHLFYNFAKSPFYVGAGWQFGPAARKITENGEIIQKSASRFLLTFGVDVPIFNLYKVNDN